MMPLQFITGDLSVNKKSELIEKMVQLKAQNPDAIIYYLVPEHLKFDTESFVLEELQKIYETQQAAMIDIQVVSFTRLAWFMLPANLKSTQNLSTIGLSMLVRQILSDYADQLLVYRGQINYQGFIEKLVSLFEELFEGNIEPEDLQVSWFDKELNVEENIPNIEAQRLKEIQLLYSAYIVAVKERHLASYENYDALSSYLNSSKEFDNHYLFVDNHYYFNAKQTSLLLDVIKTFKQVWITMPLTSDQAHSSNWQPLVQVPHDTYKQLKELCLNLNLSVLEDWDIHSKDSQFKTSIEWLAKYFYKAQSQERLPQINNNLVEQLKHSHHFAQFDSLQTELRHVSNQIHALVSNEGYRYRDILVLARDLDRYQPMVEPFFAMNNIPLFFDHAMSMSQHPFMLWLEGLLNLKRYNWRYDDLMLLLKNDIFVEASPTKGDFNSFKENEWQDWLSEQHHQISHFENVLIANGYFGYRFYNETFEWNFQTSELAYTNHKGHHTQMTLFELVSRKRNWLLETVYKPLQAWKDEMSGAEAAQWLYDLVELSGVKQQMIRIRDASISKGDIDASRRHEQVWQVFRDTLDEFYLLYEHETIDFRMFFDILFAGLKEGSYHIIPPTIDQVTFSNMVSPQVQPFKVCFILGADDNSLPQKPSYTSLLTEDNRNLIAEGLLPHQYLMEHVSIHNHQELFLTYQLLLSASEKLYISYASMLGSQQVKFSPYIENIAKELNLPIRSYHNLLNEKPDQKLSLSHFGRYPMQITPILQRVRFYYEQQLAVSNDLRLLLKEMSQYQAEHPNEVKRPLKELIKATFTFNELPQNIQAETALKLFGKNLNLSVSKIEQYYQDPYSHFLLHGLKLQERQLFELNPAKTGDYFHDFLDFFMKKLISEKLSLKHLTSNQFDQLFTQTKNDLKANPRFNLFESQPRLSAIKFQMDRRLYDFIRFMQQQQHLVAVDTLKTEAIFGLNKQAIHLDGFVYPLRSGGQLSISGKIDRIDGLNINQKHYLQVIDYKSGKKNFDLVDAYYGLDLQVLTYLSVALKNYSDYSALGAFYQPILHSYQKVDNQIETTDNLDEMIHQLHLNANRLNGFVTVPSDMLQEIDATLVETNKSLVYPVTLKKDGDYNAHSVAFSEQELDTLLKYTHYMFKQAAEQIQSGHIELQPFLHERFTPALQNEYRVITGFDATQSYSAYRHKAVKKKEVFDMMVQELTDEEGDEDNRD